MSQAALTDEQQIVATAGPARRLLVTAGPGTGKTHTLVARIGQLVDIADVPPGGILALSFSRAAVSELHRRLRATGADAGRVAPITFDSFATRLLSQIDPNGSWIERTYDGRIAEALSRIDDCADYLVDIEHVCVDEVQDLVGVRMRFVCALLDRMPAGFTLLGDPAQGIYDFTLNEGETPETDGSPAFYRWIRERFTGDLTEVALSVNHRATSSIAQRVSAVGQLVLDDPSKAADTIKGMLGEVPRLPGFGMLRNLSGEGRTAVLCRTNGQALWVSRALHNEGIGHVLQRGATNRSVAPWVARLLRSTGGGITNQSRFAAVLDELGPSAPDPSEVWAPIRRVARDAGGVDLSRLSRLLRTGSVPDELHLPVDSPLVVSTVHRAKGLEFDRVVVVVDGWDPPFDTEAARTLFVAVSRTRETLMSAELPKVDGYLKKDGWTDRWVCEHWKGSRRLGVEVLPDDVDRLQPAGEVLLDRDPLEIQESLWREVAPGDAVELRLIRARIGAPGAYYAVVRDGQSIGLMSDRFGEDLMRVLKRGNNWKYPRRIGGLTIDAVRSVGGDPTVTDQVGLGPGGAWLVPALVGLGWFE